MELLQAPEGVGLISKLTDSFLTLGVLAVGIWYLVKQNEKYRKVQEDKLAKLEERIEKYESEDMVKVLDQLQRSTEVQHETNVTLRATNTILQCFIGEMHEFKSSELYKSYLKAKAEMI